MIAAGYPCNGNASSETFQDYCSDTTVTVLLLYCNIVFKDCMVLALFYFLTFAQL